MSDVEHMIKMANQIADNFSYHDDQVARTADHLKRFWAPQMRKKLATYASESGAGLSGPVLEALRQLEA